MIEKYNDRVTSDYNALPCKTKKQQDFMTRALSINLEGRPFTSSDFPEYSDTNFRQMKLKLKGRIELVSRSSCGFYKVKGVILGSKKPLITSEPMGVGKSIIPLLESLKEQPPAIHDVKIQFSSENLHKILKEKGYEVNPNNGCIILEIPISHNLKAKILVYPKTIQINFACTSKPLVYDIRGAIDLSVTIGRVQQYLVDLTEGSIKMTPPQKWICKQYHFGKDGTENLSGPKFEYTMDDVTVGMIRCYSKEMPDGKIIPRVEQIKMPNTTLDEEVQNMIKQ